MSSLRRRFFGGDGGTESPRERTPSPAPATRNENTETDGPQDNAHVKIPRKKLEHFNSYVTSSKNRKPKGGKRRNAWVFGLGGLFGIVVAVYFAGNAEVLDLSYLKDLNLDSILDVLPAGMIKEAHDFQVCGRLPSLVVTRAA